MTSNTTISLRTVLAPSLIVPCAGDRVKAVSPPNRSVRLSRTAANCSAAKARPLLSFKGKKYLDQVHCRHLGSEPLHPEHEKQRNRNERGDQQGAKTAQ